MRSDSRTPEQMRPIKVTPHFTKHAAGSVLIEIGSTVVLCNVSVDHSLPPFLRGVKNQGWVTAEYAMLPASTHTRSRRERNKISGRSSEIQRLIGRCLRGVVDLKKIPEMTFHVDCDVLQADGGTRTTSITGACIALKLAVQKLIASGKLKENPVKYSVAAVSCGIVEDEVLVDLDYNEDSNAQTDMNVVMTDSGGLLEVQGTAEKDPFTPEQLNTILSMAKDALDPVFSLQEDALEGNVIEA